MLEDSIFDPQKKGNSQQKTDCFDKKMSSFCRQCDLI